MKQPEALRLAELIRSRFGNDLNDDAAAELRRLHEVNQMLLEATKELMDTKSYWWQEVNEETIERLNTAIEKAGEA